MSSRSLPRNNGEISFVTKSFNQFSSRESPLDRSLIKAKSKEVLSKNSLMDSEKFENNDLTNFKYFGANNKNKENKESNMIKNVADLLFDNKNNLEKNSNEIENDEDWENSKKLVEELFEKNNNNFKINPYSDINNNKDNNNNPKDNNKIKENILNKNIFEKNLENDEDWENSKKLVEELFENNNNNFKINPYSDLNNNKDNNNNLNKNNKYNNMNLIDLRKASDKNIITALILALIIGLFILN